MNKDEENLKANGDYPKYQAGVQKSKSWLWKLRKAMHLINPGLGTFLSLFIIPSPRDRCSLTYDGVHPPKSTSWKYIESKILLIHLAYWTASLQLAQYTYISLQLGIILRFISRVIAFFFSPETVDKDRHFVDRMRCENTKHHIQNNVGNTVHYRALVVYPCDRAVWELRLTATAQHPRECWTSYTSSGKDQNSKLEVQFLLSAVSLLYHH